MRRPRLAFVVLPFLIGVSASDASALTLFSLDFENGAYGLPSPDDGRRSVAAIKGSLGCASNPAADPICLATTSFPPHPTLENEATDQAINVRKATNPINSEAFGGFDDFFSSNFLVIGDHTGELSGEPNGQTDGEIAIAELRLALPELGEHTIRISYDFVFDTNRASNGDDWSAEASSGLGSVPLQFFGSPDPNGGTRGHFSVDIDPTLASELVFRLVEYNGTGSSAIGLDNIRIEQVPEPETLALVGVGLLFCAVRRRIASSRSAGPA
jgi:hypothetical protein